MSLLQPSTGSLPIILAVNGAVALSTAGVSLVVLLIAPLGLAAVLTCTILIALVSFAAGVAADLLLWRWLGQDRWHQVGGGAGHAAEAMGPGDRQGIAGVQTRRLPRRRLR